MKIKLISKTEIWQYNGTTYSLGVCAICNKAKPHTVKWMFQMWICPLCNFEFKKLLGWN